MESIHDPEAIEIIAELLFETMRAKWKAERQVWLLAWDLVRACPDRETLKQVASDYLHTSHRNAERWAQNWEAVREMEWDSIYSAREHLIRARRAISELSPPG